MKIQLNFTDTNVLAFDLSKMDNSNYIEIVDMIIVLINKRIQIFSLRISKYMKKSNILPSRNFYIKLYKMNIALFKEIPTPFENVQFSNPFI